MSGDNRNTSQNVSNNESSSNQDGGNDTLPPGQQSDLIPLVFFQESSLFGMPKRNPNDYLTHEEMYNALGGVIDASHITGLQRVNGLWRIYMDNLEDKAVLITSGVTLRGKTLPILKANPQRLDSTITTRIRIQDIPLSVDDGLITRVLIVRGVDVLSNFREKLRINGKLTNCQTGDRLVIVKASSLKQPLPRKMQFAQFKAKVIYRGQNNNNNNLKCAKCLEPGHSIFQCENEWRCTDCNQIGHKRGQCAVESDPSGGNLSNASEASDASDDESSPETTVEISQPEDGAQSQEGSPPQAPQSKPRRKKKKAKKQNQGHKHGQSRIDQFMSAANGKDTPNKTRSRSVMRSPPTPVDILHDNAKKPCI